MRLYLNILSGEWLLVIWGFREKHIQVQEHGNKVLLLFMHVLGRNTLCFQERNRRTNPSTDPILPIDFFERAPRRPCIFTPSKTPRWKQREFGSHSQVRSNCYLNEEYSCVKKNEWKQPYRLLLR
jgi:hypothetical protein